MRTMYDGITPGRLPHGGQLYASYVDGHWPNYRQLATTSAAIGAVHVSIAVDPAHDAQVLDVELYDATPAQAVPWAVRQRRRGQVPTVYSNTSTWPAIRAAFKAAGVALPQWWAANYSLTKNSPLPAGAIALQYDSQPGYDTSHVAAFWPGVDKPKPTPKPTAKPRHVVRAEDTLYSIAKGWHVSLAALEHANPHAGHPAGNFGLIRPGDVIVHP